MGRRESCNRLNSRPDFEATFSSYKIGTRHNALIYAYLIIGGDGGESNSPSNRSDPESTTGLFSSLILRGKPQLNESSRASRLVFRRPYRPAGGGTPTLLHPGPDPPGWGQAGWASLFSQPEPIQVRQLFFAIFLMRWMAPQPAIP